MKQMLMFAALMFATAAQAQIALPLLPCQDIVTPRPMTAAVRPAGLPPQLSGSCGTPMLESNTTGAAAAYWCTNAPPALPTLYLYAVRWSAITAPMLADFALLGLPGDNAARIGAMQAKYQTENVWDMCDVWGPARERINAAMPAPPPPVTWRVARYSTLTTRPAYRVNADGVRSPLAAGRATIGAVCNCAVPITEGTVTYCPADTAPLVAVCTRS